MQNKLTWSVSRWRPEWLLLLLFSALLILNRVMVYRYVNLSLIDSDQPFMWIGAADYAKGHVYEPRFYGQDYNTFLESLFALPYLYAGLPVYKALPLATHTLFLLPFLFIAFYLSYKKSPSIGLLVLAIPLCLPAGYEVLTGIPRGFITGIFFSAFLLPALVNPLKPLQWTLSAVLAVLGYFINANSVMVSLPVLFYLFLVNLRTPRYYLFTGLGLLSVVPCYFLFDYFYALHPDYVVYNLVNEFDLKYFLQNLTHLDEAFVHLSFIAEHQSIGMLLLIAGFTVYFYRHNQRLFLVLLCLILLLLLSFFASKVREGSNWPFYSYSRMYLGLPLLLGMLLYFVKPLKKTRRYMLVILVLGFSSYKLYTFPQAIARYSDRQQWVGVHLEHIDSVKELMRFYKAHCKQEQCDTLIIANRFWMNTYLNYGGPAIDPDFPYTMETNSERRYRVREAMMNRVVPRFVYISAKYDLDRRLAQNTRLRLKRLDDYGLYLVQGNTYTMSEFCSLINPIEESD